MKTALPDIVNLPETLGGGAGAVALTFEEFYRDDDYCRARQPMSAAAMRNLRLVPLNVDQYHRMAEVGILPEGAPIELLDGILFWKDRREWRGKQLPTELVALTTDQYDQMIETGILPEGAPIELIDGLLVFKDRSGIGEDPMTIGTRHNLVVQLLSQLSAKLASQRCHLQLQGPLALAPRGEPEPDGAVVRGEAREYASRKPGSDDVSAVLEVSETSLQDDRTRKLSMYAEAGIRQYLIINLAEMQIEVYEQPVSAERRYATVKTYKAGQTFSLSAGEGKSIEVAVAELLP